MKILFPVIATHRDGDTVLLYDLMELSSFVRGRRVGSNWFGIPSTRFGIPTYRALEVVQYDWILRDDAGRPIDWCAVDLPELPNWRFGGFYATRYKYYAKRRKELQNAIDKGLPIPGTGKRKRGRHSCRCDYCLSSTKKRDLAKLISKETKQAVEGFDY